GLDRVEMERVLRWRQRMLDRETDGLCIVAKRKTAPPSGSDSQLLQKSSREMPNFRHGAEWRRRICVIAPAVRFQDLLQPPPLCTVSLVPQVLAERVEIGIEIDRRQPVSGLFADNYIFVKEHVVTEVEARNGSALQPFSFSPGLHVISEVTALAAKVSHARASLRGVADADGAVVMQIAIVEGEVAAEERRVAA